MSFMEAVRSVYRNFFNFQGRAPRSEYWWFFLFNILVAIVIGIVEAALGLGQGSMSSGPGEVSMQFAGGPLSIIWALVNIIPGIAVGIRRLHDTDRSGWWTFIALIPLVGVILLIVWYATKGTAGSNRFGDDPLAGRG
jgi:uncharacterized membrane protein YhaH (DUF805 family)